MVALKCLLPRLQSLYLPFLLIPIPLIGSCHFGTIHPFSKVVHWRPILFPYFLTRVERRNGHIVLSLSVGTSVLNDTLFVFLAYLDFLYFFLFLNVLQDVVFNFGAGGVERLVAP